MKMYKATSSPGSLLGPDCYHAKAARQAFLRRESP